jgi:hypothetical protein
MKTKDEIEPISIYTGSLFDVQMLKNLLENEGIESFLKDEFIGTIAPWYILPSVTGSVTLVISTSDYDKAQMILKQFERDTPSTD